MIEEKIHMQGVILKESKDSLELVLDIERAAKSDSPHDQKMRAQAQEMREMIAKKE